MIVVVFLHMGRVFFFGAYKYPRELTWVTGALLLILTMFMGLTGYLLVWDQKAYWATVVAMNITAKRAGHRPLHRRHPARRTGVRPDTSRASKSKHMLVIPIGIVHSSGSTLPDHEAGHRRAALQQAPHRG